MISYQWLTYKGFCPKLKQYRTLNIKYAEISIQEFKKLEDDCSNKLNCPYTDKFDRCPICLSAPETPFAK